MEIQFYQAECGDAARIRFFGTDKKYHNVMVDSGYERTFRHIIAKEIKEIEDRKEAIDLWIISHIHDDHIGGASKYIKSIEDGENEDIVKMWYYNTPRTLKATEAIRVQEISEPKSISQGDAVMDYLLSKGLPVKDITNDDSVEEFYGLKLTVLSPDKATLAKLRGKYSDKSVAFERTELDSISQAKAASKYDYHIPIEKFDLAKWNEDDSIENRSSISVITEFQNKRILWLADAHPSVIVKKLKKLGYSKTNQIRCDWVKVTHHGSKGNNSDELFELISCENYLISANAENIHCLPTKECIARILRNPARRLESHYKFTFTYDNQLLRSMFKDDGEEIHKKLNFSLHYPEMDLKSISVY